MSGVAAPAPLSYDANRAKRAKTMITIDRSWYAEVRLVRVMSMTKRS